MDPTRSAVFVPRFAQTAIPTPPKSIRSFEQLEALFAKRSVFNINWSPIPQLSYQRLIEALQRTLAVQCHNGVVNTTVYDSLRHLLLSNGLQESEVTIAGSYVLKILGWPFIEDTFKNVGINLEEVCEPYFLEELKAKFDGEPHDIDMRIKFPDRTPSLKFDHLTRDQLKAVFNENLKAFFGGEPCLKETDNVVEGLDQFLCVYLGVPQQFSAEFCFYESLANRNLCTTDAFHITLPPFFFSQKTPPYNSPVSVHTGKNCTFFKAIFDIFGNRVRLQDSKNVNALVWPKLIQQLSRDKVPATEGVLDDPLISALCSAKGSKGKYLAKLLLKKFRDSEPLEQFKMLKTAESSCLKNVGVLGLTEKDIEQLLSTCFPDPVVHLCYTFYKNPSSENKKAFVAAVLDMGSNGAVLSVEQVHFLNTVDSNYVPITEAFEVSDRSLLNRLIAEYLMTGEEELKTPLLQAFRDKNPSSKLNEDLYKLLVLFDPEFSKQFYVPCKKEIYPNEVQRLCYESAYENQLIDPQQLIARIHSLLDNRQLDDETLAYITKYDSSLSTPLQTLRNIRPQTSEIERLHALYRLDKTESLKNAFILAVYKAMERGDLNGELVPLINEVDPQLGNLALRSPVPTPIRFCGALVTMSYFKAAWEIYKTIETPSTSKSKFLSVLFEKAKHSPYLSEGMEILADLSIQPDERKEIVQAFFENPPHLECALSPELILEGLSRLQTSYCEGIKRTEWLYKKILEQTLKTPALLPNALLNDVLNRFPECCVPSIHHILRVYKEKYYPFTNPVKTLENFKGLYSFYKLADLIENPSRDVCESVFYEFTAHYRELKADKEEFKKISQVILRLAPLVEKGALVNIMTEWPDEELKKAVLIQEASRLSGMEKAKKAAEKFLMNEPFSFELFNLYPLENTSEWIRAFRETPRFHKPALRALYVKNFTRLREQSNSDKPRKLFNHFLDTACPEEILSIPAPDLMSFISTSKHCKLYSSIAERLIVVFTRSLRDKTTIDHYMPLVCELSHSVRNWAPDAAEMIAVLDVDQIRQLLETGNIESEELILQVILRLSKLNSPSANALIYIALTHLISKPVSLLKAVHSLQDNPTVLRTALLKGWLSPLKNNSLFHKIIKPVVDLNTVQFQSCETLMPFFETPEGRSTLFSYFATETTKEIEVLIANAVRTGTSFGVCYPYGGISDPAFIPFFVKQCKSRLTAIEGEKDSSFKETAIGTYLNILHEYIEHCDCACKPNSDLSKIYKMIFSTLRKLPQNERLKQAYLSLFTTAIQAATGKSNEESRSCIFLEENPWPLSSGYRVFTEVSPGVHKDMAFPSIQVASVTDKSKYFDHFFYLMDLITEEAKVCPSEIKFQYIELLGYQLKEHLTEFTSISNASERRFLLEKYVSRLQAFAAIPETNFKEYCKKINIVKEILLKCPEAPDLEKSLLIPMINLRSFSGICQRKSTHLNKQFNVIKETLLKSFKDPKVPQIITLTKFCSFLESCDVSSIKSRELFASKMELLEHFYHDILPNLGNTLSTPDFPLAFILDAIQAGFDPTSLHEPSGLNFSLLEGNALENFPTRFLNAVGKNPLSAAGLSPVLPQYKDIHFLEMEVLNHKVCRAKSTLDEGISETKLGFSLLEQALNNELAYPEQYELLVEKLCGFALLNPATRDGNFQQILSLICGSKVVEIQKLVDKVCFVKTELEKRGRMSK